MGDLALDQAFGELPRSAWPWTRRPKCQIRPSSSSSCSLCFCLAGSAIAGGAG